MHSSLVLQRLALLLFSCLVQSDSCDSMDRSPPGSLSRGFLARMLELVAISFSRRSNRHLLHWQADSLPLTHKYWKDLLSHFKIKTIWIRYHAYYGQSTCVEFFLIFITLQGSLTFQMCLYTCLVVLRVILICPFFHQPSEISSQQGTKGNPKDIKSASFLRYLLLALLYF